VQRHAAGESAERTAGAGSSAAGVRKAGGGTQYTPASTAGEVCAEPRCRNSDQQ